MTWHCHDRSRSPPYARAIAERLLVSVGQKTFTEDEVQKLREAETNLKQLMDTALALPEPRRTTVMTTLLQCEQHVQ